MIFDFQTNFKEEISKGKLIFPVIPYKTKHHLHKILYITFTRPVLKGKRKKKSCCELIPQPGKSCYTTFPGAFSTLGKKKPTNVPQGTLQRSSFPGQLTSDLTLLSYLGWLIQAHRSQYTALSLQLLLPSLAVSSTLSTGWTTFLQKYFLRLLLSPLPVYVSSAHSPLTIPVMCAHCLYHVLKSPCLSI